jgi:hypothetical protein
MIEEVTNMKRIKVRFHSREESRIMAEVMKRGEVIVLRDLTFLVAEPAIIYLENVGAKYDNLGEESWDRVVRTLRSTTPSKI